MKIKGRVNRVVEKNGVSSNGKPYTMYAVSLDTADGDKLVGTRFDRPQAPPGAIISIEAFENNRGYLDGKADSIQVLREESSPAPASGAVASGVSAADLRQRSITAQSAYRTAAPVLATALEQDVIKLPKAKTQASDTLDAYLEALDRVAQHIFNQTLNGMEIVEEEQETTEEEGTYDPLQ